jgi:RNA polymerase sigma-70 factor (ECF subfamily)
VTKRVTPDVRGQVARLFVDEADAVSKAARRVASDEREAEDMVQEAFHAAAENWDRIATYSPDKRRAWLCRVAINKAIDRYRAGRRTQLGVDPADMSQVAPSAEDTALTRIEKDCCWKAMREMPLKQRTVAYLRWHEEWTAKEIAEGLGIATSTVRVHLRNALTAVNAAVGDEVVITDELDDDEPDDRDSRGGKEAR